jgi:hypothetical protein
MKAPSNIKQLRDDMLKVYTMQRNGEATPAEVREVNNTARTVVASCKVQLDYAKLKGEKPHVGFLETNEQ